MLETIALWWCYIAGATLAVGVYAVIAMWAIDKAAECLNLKKEILLWYRDRAKAKSKFIPG